MRHCPLHALQSVHRWGLLPRLLLALCGLIAPMLVFASDLTVSPSQLEFSHSVDIRTRVNPQYVELNADGVRYTHTPGITVASVRRRGASAFNVSYNAGDFPVGTHNASVTFSAPDGRSVSLPIQIVATTDRSDTPASDPVRILGTPDTPEPTSRPAPDTDPVDLTPSRQRNIPAPVTPAPRTPVPDPSATNATTTPVTSVPPTPDTSAPLTVTPPALEFEVLAGQRVRVVPQKVTVNPPGGYGWEGTAGVNIARTPTTSLDVSIDTSAFPIGVHATKAVFVGADGRRVELPIRVVVASSTGVLKVNRQQLAFGGVLGEMTARESVELSYTGQGQRGWTATGPNWLTLDPPSGEASLIAPARISISVNESVLSGSRIREQGEITVSDGSTTHKIAVSLAALAAGAPRVELTGLEVTQGIQNLYNDAPFVAQRPAFVRAHLQSLVGTDIDSVSAQLVGTRSDGTPLGILTPDNAGGAIRISALPDRGKLEDSLYFRLPPDWLTGQVSLRLQGLSEAIACADPAERSTPGAVANDCTVSLSYETIPTLPITYVLFSEHANRTFYTANAAHAAATTRQLRAGLPIPSVDSQILPTTQYFSGARQNSAGNRIALATVKTIHAAAPIADQRRHYYGLFARYDNQDPTKPVQGGPGGVANVPGFTGMGEYYPFQEMGTLNMHEIGHNLGRSHVYCPGGNAANPDSTYPIPEGRISSAVTGPEAYHGFNIETLKIHPPTAYDYMSYCGNSWISPHTYKAMMARLKIHYLDAQSGPGSTQIGASPGSRLVVISGSLQGNSSGSIDRVVDDIATGPVTVPRSSMHSVRLDDANGQLIATYPVTAQTVAGQDGAASVGYLLAVPRPDTLGRVTVQYQDRPLAERQASANAPTLTLLAPTAGESLQGQALTIRWEASDADGDALSYSVDYSRDDGANWTRIATDWPESQIKVDSAGLPGSAAARIRVAANDGFLTTFALSEAFTVSDQPPVAGILTTVLNAQYVAGQRIDLQGMAHDREDGVLDTLSWYSDRDGLLGSGPSLSIYADALSEGPHQIRVEATDSQGQRSAGVAAGSPLRDSVQIEVSHTLPAMADLLASDPPSEPMAADEPTAAEPVADIPDPTSDDLIIVMPPDNNSFPIPAGRELPREQRIYSESGGHYLIFQADGNVVVYTVDDAYVWGLQSITDRYSAVQYVRMQDDGNFAVYAAGEEYIWSALQENPDPSAYLSLTPDGVLQLVSGQSGQVLWQSQ